jgi:hypothetical protein
LELYQFIAPSLALFYIYRLIVELKRRKRFLITNVMWLVFWVLIGLLGVVPHEVSSGVAEWLGFASNINAVIFIALAFLVVLCFYLSAKIDRMERKITELVRQLALDENKIRELEKKREAARVESANRALKDT